MARVKNTVKSERSAADLSNPLSPCMGLQHKGIFSRAIYTDGFGPADGEKCAQNSFFFCV